MATSSGTQLLDLPDDMLCEILSRLPTNKLLTVERVSRDWRRCVKKVIGNVEVIGYWPRNRPSDDLQPQCKHIHQLANDWRAINIWDFPDCYEYSLHWRRLEITSKTVNFLVRLLSRCPSVKCLDLRSLQVAADLKPLVDACPNLECLSIGSVQAVGFTYHAGTFSKQLPKLYQQLNSKLVHLRLINDVHSLMDRTYRLSSAVSLCKNLGFVESTVNEDETVDALSQLDNRVDISLIINRYFYQNLNPVHLKCVLTRTKCLNTDFPTVHALMEYEMFAQLRYLILDSELEKGNFILLESAIPFPALEYLQIDYPTKRSLRMIAGYKFGQLKSVKLNDDSLISCTKINRFLCRLLAENKHLKRFTLSTNMKGKLHKLGEGFNQIRDLSIFVTIFSNSSTDFKPMTTLLQQLVSLQRLEIQFEFIYRVPAFILKKVFTCLSIVRRKHYRVSIQFKLLVNVNESGKRENEEETKSRWLDEVSRLPQVAAVEVREERNEITYNVLVDYDKLD